VKKLIKVTTGAFKLLANTFTLGGLPRLERAKSDYDFKYKRYKKDYDRLFEINDSVNQETENIGKEIEGIRILINQSARVLECLNTCDANELSFDKKISVTKQNIKSLNTGYSTVLSAGFGGLVGGCGAAGAWTLVAFAGSASTGTAIGTLSGVAATNATLAWFGGGALAAGGAGMAGGTLVLGGLVFAPLVYFAARGSHKKSAEIEKEVVRVDAEHQKIKDVIPDAEKVAEELFNTANTIKQLCRNLRTNMNDQHTKLNSLSWFGFLGFRLKRYLRIPLKPKERDAVNKITDAINDFLLNFNLEKDLYD
jgi:hypothetical protein